VLENAAKSFGALFGGLGNHCADSMIFCKNRKDQVKIAIGSPAQNDRRCGQMTHCSGTGLDISTGCEVSSARQRIGAFPIFSGLRKPHGDHLPALTWDGYWTAV